MTIHKKKYSEQDIIDALRKCAKDLNDPKFGIKKYVEWRREQKGSYPSGPLIANRRSFSDTKKYGWTSWKIAAGLPCSEQPKGFGEQTIDDTTICRAIARIESKVGSFPTMGEYNQLKTNNDPSDKTLIARYKSWTQARGFYLLWKKENSTTKWYVDITVE